MPLLSLCNQHGSCGLRGAAYTQCWRSVLARRMQPAWFLLCPTLKTEFSTARGFGSLLHFIQLLQLLQVFDLCDRPPQGSEPGAEPYQPISEGDSLLPTTKIPARGRTAVDVGSLTVGWSLGLPATGCLPNFLSSSTIRNPCCSVDILTSRHGGRSQRVAQRASPARSELQTCAVVPTARCRSWSPERLLTR